MEGKLFLMAGAKSETPGAGRKDRKQAPENSGARAGMGAHGAKGHGRPKAKARLSNYEKLASEETKDREDKLELFIPPGPRLGNVVIEANGVTKAYGDKLLFDNLSFSLPPAGIVGIIGPNGAGKTTLFRLITGQEKPDAGTFRVGETVALGYVDQMHDDLDPNKSVWENITGGLETIMVGNKPLNSRAYVSKFNFNGADQQKKVGVLSGGERNRVHLSITLKKGSNVLLLDEPTNDIDVNTLRSLGRSPGKLWRLRGSHQSRPLVFGPDMYAYPGL